MKLSPTQLLALLRIYLYGVLASLTIYLLATSIGSIQNQNAQLLLRNSAEQHQIADLQSKIAELESEVADLRSRWIGDPALWQPAGVPGNVRVDYFDVTGTTQQDLIAALNNSGLCQKYHCLPDPALPNNTTAWALDTDTNIDPTSTYCYSPRTLSYQWREHVVTMPRWSPKPGSVQITLVQAWNALEGVMLIHELGHVQVAEDWLASMNAQSQQQPTCQASIAFWENPQLFDSLHAAQNAYHAKLRADCRPEVGCIPAGWMGW